MRRVLMLVVCVVFLTTLAAADVPQTEKDAIARKIASESKPDHQARGGSGESGEVSLIDASGLEYFLNTDTSETSSSASGAASDATYTTSVVGTTTGGGTTTSMLNDAFDGYGAILVNGTYYTDNGTVSFECAGRQLVYNPQNIGSLVVSRKAYVPDNDEFVRWLNFITNTSGSPVAVTLAMDNNLGSDSSTTMHDTSSGDMVWTTADTWFVTNGDYSDPKLGHIIQGPGSPAAPVANVDFSSVNDPEWDYTFTVPAGQTVCIMHFVTGQPSIADAAAKSAEVVLLGLNSNALQCTTPQEQAQIINWEQPVPVELQSIAVE